MDLSKVYSFLESELGNLYPDRRTRPFVQVRPRYFDNQITAFEDAKVVGGGKGKK